MNPLALWPIHPARVQPYITDDRRLLYFVYPDFDIRGTKVIKLGDPIILADYQMIHIKGPTEYGVWGKSVLQAMSESVGISIAAQKYGAAFYGNGAHAGGYLEHPANMGSEAISRLREQIQENHKGAGKSGSLMVLEEGMKFSSNTVSPKDAQALELRQFEVAEIARWFRIQPHKLQDLTRATYSNIESQNLDYVTDTLLSWTTRWEQELHIKLLGGVDDLLVKFDFDFLLRGDRAARASYFSTMRFMGAINVNEIRRAEDMNDIGPKGDEYHQQSAMVPLGQVPEQKTNSFDGLAKNTAARIAQKEIKACQAEIKKERDHSEWIASFWLDQFGYAISSFLPIVETMAGLKLLDGPETIKALDETMKNFYSNRSTTPSTADQIFEAFRASQRH
jgi:HK97 family phage portal protein